MAKTLIDIDRGKLVEAQKILGTTTMTATVNEAIDRVIRKRAFERMLDYAAGLDEEQRTVLANIEETHW